MLKRLIPEMLRSKPLIEPQSAQWVYDTFEWGITNFDTAEFKRCRLIQPDNHFFPGRVDSIDSKALTIFEHTVRYTGLSHWPFELQPAQNFCDSKPVCMALDNVERNSEASTLARLPMAEPFYIYYNSHQTTKPEDLSASYAHAIAQHMVFQRQAMPPGGEAYFAEGTEILAILMGFGVMLTNSAHTYRGGCGSCYNPYANRQATLYEDELIFALALFCRIKNIECNEATNHLKKHLRRNYKRALKQIDAEPNKLAHLQKIAAGT